MFYAISSIPLNDVFWSTFYDYDIHFQKDDRWILQLPVLQINQDFPAHKLFSQFWRYPYENFYTRLKTGHRERRRSWYHLLLPSNHLTNDLNDWEMYIYIGEGF